MKARKHYSSARRRKAGSTRDEKDFSFKSRSLSKVSGNKPQQPVKQRDVVDSICKEVSAV